ncbi:PREDICTED: uncharacterized protein LOC109207392 [Nicotiana attenuata]|uniref:uncharacterized protein LOC109207392 n=1 Tax=Nicotiana attenuata TaxID=49451 RepID=UPI000905CAC8|nr:PREDICTED: uncharacterized protein LOC109207392 [Nicotiana attenuata]
MASKELDASVIDPPKEIEESESGQQQVVHLDDLAQALARHFQYNVEIVPDRLSLIKIEKKPNESFREYGFRWREQAARVNPQMEEAKMVEYFLQALEPTYFGHLILAICKSFNEVVNMGGMVEEGLKSSKIMSYSALKETTQAIQNGNGGVLRKKKKEDVAMVISGSWHGLTVSPHHYTQPRPQPQTYTQTSYNPPQHYFPPQNPQYSVRPLQYHVHHAQQYAQPPPHPQWRARAPQNSYPPPKIYRNPIGPIFRPGPELRQLDVLRLIESKLPNPPPKNLDYSLRCAYCSDAPGNDTEKCLHLKNAIQDLIDTNQIVVQSPKTPNINQNPLPAHAETHMIEIVYKGGEPENPSKSVMMICATDSNSVKTPVVTNATSSTAEELKDKISPPNVKPPVFVVKGFPYDVKAKQGKPKVVVPGSTSKPIIIVEGARTDPIIIKPVTQLSVNNTKVVPWNYKQVIVTYKGKEVEEEVNETRGLTRSGRCISLEELRKAKPPKDNPILVKKSVTEEQAENFLRKMKV